MRYFGSVIFVLVFSILAAAPFAYSQKRVALVIGNSAYQHTPRLTNPTNDATDIGVGLKKHGFQVIDGFDLDKPAFERKVREFAAALNGADAGLFFYAGHGLQVAGQNYLVPIDAKAEGMDALEFEMIRAEAIQRIMERQSNTNILFLDACRDNPLARNLARSMGTRSLEVGRGLAAVESGIGTLISFSTQPGNVAIDGAGRNSPFSGSLVKHMSTAANDDLNAILIAVRNDVMKDTQRKQVPWEHSALTGRFYFNLPARTTEPSNVEAVEIATKPVAKIVDISAKKPGTAIGSPVAIGVEEVVKGRISRGQDHFWRFEGPAGKYRFVLDAKNADDRSYGLIIGVKASAGGSETSVVSLSDNQYRQRGAASFVIPEGGLTLRVGDAADMTDYWLAVTTVDAEIAMPYFAKTPAVTPLQLGTPVSAVLSPSEPEAWFSTALEAKDYKVTAEFTRTDKASRMSVDLSMFGSIGERMNGLASVCSVTENAMSGTCASKLSLAQDGPVTLRVSALWKGHYQATVKLEPIDVAGMTDGAARLQR
jgi:uncharacterized caspase-like protein